MINQEILISFVNQLRSLSCSRNILNRAHGSAPWSHGNTIVLASVYGPKAGTRKGEKPERASFEVIWKPKTGQIGKQEREYEMVLKTTIQSICLVNVHLNTTTSIIVQVVGDDGSLLPCVRNASCAALVDAGIPMKHFAVATSCGVMEEGSIILDLTKSEEEEVKACAYLVFPNSPPSVILKITSSSKEEPIVHGIITSVTYGAMPVNGYFDCLERGQAACAAISEFLRRSLQKQSSEDPSRAA